MNYRPLDLDCVFATLSDPTRRAILARLAQEESVTVSALAEPFSIKLPAVMNHLDVLCDAGLITRSKHGRTVNVRLSPAPLREASEWLRHYERFWSPALDGPAGGQGNPGPGCRGEREGSMRSLTLVRRIAARPSTVFEAMTTAEGVAAWFGPDDLPIIRAAMDARVGGAYRVHFRTLDGRAHEACGEFLEVVPPRRVVMSWSCAFGGELEEGGRTSRVEIEITPNGDGIELTLSHAGFWTEASENSHAQRWTAAFEKLVRYLERAAATTNLTSDTPEQ